jgi:hypothetical protein
MRPPSARQTAKILLTRLQEQGTPTTVIKAIVRSKLVAPREN